MAVGVVAVRKHFEALTSTPLWSAFAVAVPSFVPLLETVTVAPGAAKPVSVARAQCRWPYRRNGRQMAMIREARDGEALRAALHADDEVQLGARPATRCPTALVAIADRV